MDRKLKLIQEHQDLYTRPTAFFGGSGNIAGPYNYRPSEPEDLMASVTETLLNEKFDKALANADVIVASGNVTTETRHGSYVTVRQGMTVAVWFTGIGRKKGGDKWEQMVEIVGP